MNDALHEAVVDWAHSIVPWEITEEEKKLLIEMAEFFECNEIKRLAEELCSQ